MARNANIIMPDLKPSEFTRQFHKLVGEAINSGVPLDFMIVNLEVTKIDLANRFIQITAQKRSEKWVEKMSENVLQQLKVEPPKQN